MQRLAIIVILVLAACAPETTETPSDTRTTPKSHTGAPVATETASGELPGPTEQVMMIDMLSVSSADEKATTSAPVAHCGTLDVGCMQTAIAALGGA